MKVIQKFMGTLLAVCMAAQLLAVPAFATEEKPVYLALGDSISTGYRLPGYDKETVETNTTIRNFVNLIAERLGYELVNEAQDGLTTEGLATQLESGALDQDISRARLITITCGGNDMMQVLYGLTAGYYNENYGGDLTADDISTFFSQGNIPGKAVSTSDLFMSAYDVICGVEELDDEDEWTGAYLTCPAVQSPEFLAAINALSEGPAGTPGTLDRIMGYIREINPSAVVVLTTQYNPYTSLPDGLSGALKRQARDLYKAVDNCLAQLNPVILNNAEALGYIQVDIATTFKNSDDNLCNAYFTSADKYDLDIHPNALGHQKIAETITALALTPSVDTDLAAGSVTLSLTGSEAQAVAAFYDADGRMVGVASQKLTSTQSSHTLTATLKGAAVSAKVMLLHPKNLSLGFDVL